MIFIIEATIRQSISLDKKTSDFLDKIKEKYKIPKSATIRTVLQYFIDKEDELIEILTGDL